MKIVVAMDSFKGTLTAYEACKVISKALRSVLSDVTFTLKPMADGGEGTARAMIEAGNGDWLAQKVAGPLPESTVNAGFAWFPDRTALVEMAAASGLELLTADQLDPLRTTTYGTGELIAAAAKQGARRILLAVGGSATVDGGIGAAAALGWNFLDSNGQTVPLSGRGLEMISKIGKSGNLRLPPVEVLCDVDNPLCGDHGAARVYGPQKGATPAMVEQLERGLANLADIVRAQLATDIENIPGAGAAGGLAAGAIAFMDATIVSGIETVMNRSNLEAELASADWVITGEGSFDRQSLYGKVVSGILKLATQSDTRIAVLAGQINIPRDEYRKMGIEVALATKPDDLPLDDALKNSRELLFAAAERLTREYLTA
ncbi:MAG: glycerate kinase [Planctomycetota bacterium]|nr:glycerate kinase [Planctomycetota bacterium]